MVIAYEERRKRVNDGYCVWRKINNKKNQEKLIF